ncbi:MAG: hypothetical protein A3A51_05185 [Candidatus Levybacteria bacterium RIFCSPLOWO2_01_FULL_39_10]|nr:MAG: hypothetical protein A3A51_05185 [Candidatus Levybacteria bacterium RIFCSPLOWO2_01_FULL_39_10]
MTATGHAVIGTVIAASIPNPVIAIPLALASHVVADLFPHWDPGTNRKEKTNQEFLSGAMIDVGFSYILTFLLIVFLFPQTDLLYAYIVVFAAQFFDWAASPYTFFKVKNPPIFQWFYRFQKKFDNRLDKPWGIISQVAALAGLVLLVLFI